MSRFDESLAASQDLLDAALEREIAGAGAALQADGSAECIDSHARSRLPAAVSIRPPGAAWNVKPTSSVDR